LIIAIQGSKSFNDYPVFMNAMGTAMFWMTKADENDKEIFVYSAGASKLNSLATGFVNITQDSLKAREIKIQLRKIPPSWIKNNLEYIDYFAYFCTKGESLPPVVDLARSKNVKTEPYRY
jgi:hypothetical protein